jgi:hypothetical protein
MSGCGCNSSKGFSFSPGTGIDETSNSTGEATWFSGSTGNSPSGDISNRSPYGGAPVFGGISFCKKCFLTWAIVFLILAFIFYRKG